MNMLKTIPTVVLALLAGTAITPKLQDNHKPHKVRYHKIKESLKPTIDHGKGNFVLATDPINKVEFTFFCIGVFGIMGLIAFIDSKFNDGKFLKKQIENAAPFNHERLRELAEPTPKSPTPPPPTIYRDFKIPQMYLENPAIQRMRINSRQNTIGPTKPSFPGPDKRPSDLDWMGL